MSYGTFNALSSLLNLGTFLIAVMLLAPKSVKSWKLWRKTGKDAHLSGAVAGAAAALILLAGNLCAYIKAVLGV